MPDFSRFATALPFAAVTAPTEPTIPPSPEPPAAPEASPTLPPAGSIRSSLLSSAAVLRNLGDRALIPSLVDPFVSRGEGSQMWTRLSHSAIQVLNESA